eukprot:TRINITY_DN45528_c0_g2_i1.p1 TRINITY_DN45528_c0_g2~~TRINITY_DN45528_c0_g2_i1.p1  ORF type:complete len:393 (-),score=106.53 TRINITY_DN45528_c0_g2_i1:50-1069(-)
MYAQSILNLVKQAGLDPIFVELRHQAAHNNIPSLSVLKLCAMKALEWLEERYWEPQRELLQKREKRLTGPLLVFDVQSRRETDGKKVALEAMIQSFKNLKLSIEDIHECVIPALFRSNYLTKYPWGESAAQKWVEAVSELIDLWRKKFVLGFLLFIVEEIDKATTKAPAKLDLVRWFELVWNSSDEDARLVVCNLVHDRRSRWRTSGNKPGVVLVEFLKSRLSAFDGEDQKNGNVETGLGNWRECPDHQFSSILPLGCSFNDPLGSKSWTLDSSEFEVVDMSSYTPGTNSIGGLHASGHDGALTPQNINSTEHLQADQEQEDDDDVQLNDVLDEVEIFE